MKTFIIICLSISLIYSIKQNEKLLYDVAVMNFALDTSGRAYQAERHLLLECRGIK